MQTFTVPPIVPNLFEVLETSVKHEFVEQGRWGTMLVEPNATGGIPLVRTTAIHKEPNQRFQEIHWKVADAIRQASGKQLEFNNAWAELYDTSYRTMGFHSDQNTDLVRPSYIALFSVYDKPTSFRTLTVRNKTNLTEVDYPMYDHSVILFDTDANDSHQHKIVLKNVEGESRWIGLTFRLSKSFVHFVDGMPYLNGKQLRLATPEEKIAFRVMRKQENETIGFRYPDYDYTLTPSDLIPPV
jgi:hypothetical protein